MVCDDVMSDIKLPLQEVLVAADVLQQSGEPLAGPTEELLAGPTEELLAGPSAPPAGPSVTTVNGHLEHGVALQQANTQVNNFGLWF